MTVDENQTPVSETPAQVETPEAASNAPTQESAELAATAEVTATEVPATEVPAAVAEVPAAEVPVAEAPIVEAPVVAKVEPTPAQPVVTEPAERKPDIKAADDTDLFDQYMSAMDSGDSDSSSDSSYKRLRKNERMEATVVQVEKDRVFVALGTKAEGIIPLNELSEKNPETALGFFEIGQKIQVVVINPQGSDGNPVVSSKRAEFEAQWDRIVSSFETTEPISAMVIDRVKGGLVVDVGVRGFVPATHVGSGKLRNIDKYVGQPLMLKVIELDRERKKVVLSNRLAEEENRATAKEDIFKNIKVSDVLGGTVRRLTDYGAFIDLGGVDGLLHISEMSWARISHPKEMFKEGDEIQVMVLRLDPAVGKISLGHRQVLPDPWSIIKQNYKIGQTLTVQLGRMVTSGCFVKLAEGAEAFLPLSEMSQKRLKRPQDVAEEDSEVEVQIIDLRPDERRMVLSMRAIGGGSELRPGAGSYSDEEYRKPRPGGGRPGATTGNRRRPGDDGGDDSRRGTATSGATIGERLGLLKGLLKPSADETPAE
jgi:predicted RNA-binding protein with RPS1 domain